MHVSLADEAERQQSELSYLGPFEILTLVPTSTSHNQCIEFDMKVPWSSGPSTRGSFQILWACLSTLFLCAWTAVHPNVQVTGKKSWMLLQRLGLMVISILFPEIIISSAWRQQRRVKMLLENIRQSDEETTRNMPEVSCPSSSM